MLITRSIRQSLRHSEGQALVLACLLMFVVSIAVLTTVHLGHGIHERVRLQNTVDASAYSSAAAEARAFNFYAFSNRTQASHYVSAMVWHSINSFAYFSEAFLTDAYGLLLSINQCVSPSVVMKPICEVIELLPYVGEAFKIINESMGAVGEAVKIMQDSLQAANVDAAISAIVRGHRTLNQTLQLASNAVMIATLSNVTTLSSGIIAANDPNLKGWAKGLPFGALTACMLDRAHFREAGGSPLSPLSPFTPLDPQAVEETNKTARAKRAMGQLTNASRFACDGDGNGACPETFVTNRSFSATNPLGFLGPAVSFFEMIVPKIGQTRMLSFQLGKGTNHDVPPFFAGNPNSVDQQANNHIRTWNTLGGVPIGAIAQGDVIGSDDLWWLNAPIPGIQCDASDDPRYCFGDNRALKNENYSRMVKTSIWSMSQNDLFPDGVHYRLLRPGRKKNGQFHAESNIGLNLREYLVVFNIYTANVNADRDDHNHRWDGLVPFNHFEPGQYAQACGLVPGRNGEPETQGKFAPRKDEFNQPSTFALLSKGPEELANPEADPTGPTRAGPARLNPEGEVTITIGSRSDTLEFDDELPTVILGRGMHAISRGQTYYHRPGNWTEQPNFFNPYWRPRLAPVLQARHQLPFVDQALAIVPDLVPPQRLITH